ncbi:hypothetical protein E3N88_28100 [Mikania micrantha]|uniref:Uncharacterized protein n=1 Tax=Mikania micrantha TaxID=192012 RepID=A0A5N6MYI9_9ASTR|nr:hypothetical protein E3N88_28100 [Mikania micrantha]
MPPRRQPPLLPLTQGSAPHSSTPTPLDSPTQPPPPPPHSPPPDSSNVQILDPATIALATLLTSQLRDVIPEMMNRINSNNGNNAANSTGEGSVMDTSGVDTIIGTDALSLVGIESSNPIKPFSCHYNG